MQKGYVFLPKPDMFFVESWYKTQDPVPEAVNKLSILQTTAS